MLSNPCKPAAQPSDLSQAALDRMLRDFDARMMRHDDGSLTGADLGIVQTLVAHMNVLQQRVDGLEQRVDELEQRVAELENPR
jgi:hypothetical protein